MQKQINLGGQKIKYDLRKSKRARYMRLAIYRGGGLVVTAPVRLDLARIENFILEKAEWVLEKISLMSGKEKSILAGSGQREFRRLKEQALLLAKIKVEKFNEFYGFKYKKISIRNQKTRWGSCSKQGNLNYNYKIALMPEDLADYVIVHELCHLGQFNHSQNFWDLVAQTIPDFRGRRKRIKGL